MEQNEQMFALMAVAEEQRKGIQEAIELLNAERLAFAQERAAWAYGMATTADMATAFEQSLKKSVASTQNLVVDTIRNEVAIQLSGIKDRAYSGLTDATSPLIGDLRNLVHQTGLVQAEAKIAAQWFTWKWMALSASGVLLAVLGAFWAHWNVAEGVRDLRKEKAVLEASIDDLDKNGGRIEFQRCGDKKRLCVRVDKTAGNWGKEGEYFVLSGY